ncbi:MAG: hypothetical protein ACMUIS_01005 [bacterium]
MSRARGAEYWIVPVIVCLFLAGFRGGGAAEWVSIHPSLFGEKGEAAWSFQDAAFDANYLYLVTSDARDAVLGNPNAHTILWASELRDDPNEWDQDLWEEIVLDGSNVRVDTLFAGADRAFAGARWNGNARVLAFSSPDQGEEISFTPAQVGEDAWRIEHGDVFDGGIYLGVYEEDFGARLFHGDAPEGPISQEIIVDGIPRGDPNVHIGFLAHTEERLFIGTVQYGSGAVLSSTTDGIEWSQSTEDSFDDPNCAGAITGFCSLTEFLAHPWVLTEMVIDHERRWALWKGDSASGASPQWGRQISSLDPNGPLSDPNILAVSGPLAIGEYLYIGCLGSDGGRIWKNYRGEKTEWIAVPSPSDPNEQFDPNNRLRGIFSNPSNEDLIFAGTAHNTGARITARHVPRVDVLSLSMTDRFIGPNKESMSMRVLPNWDDPNHWRDPNNVPDASLFTTMDPNRQLSPVSPVLMDPDGISTWEFDPAIVDQEGVYTLRFSLTYGDNEHVVRYLTFAWDPNLPSPPSGLWVGIGDTRLRIYWQPSTDSLQDADGVNDPNFTESIGWYELHYWPKDDPSQDANVMAPIGSVQGSPSLNWTIYSLDNDVTYTIRVRARDKAENVSDWSEVEGTPRQTKGWLDLVEEKGGCFISSLDSGKREQPGTWGEWFAWLKVGRFEPQSEEAKLVYDDRPWQFQFEMGWIHRRHLDVSVGVGYMKMEGTAILPATQEKSIDEVTFRMIPCVMTVRWVPYRTRGGVLLPYVGGGVDAWWYQEGKPLGKDRDGWNFGYHGLCGIRILLDHFDPKHAEVLERDHGIEDTYFTLEATYSRVDNFGASGLDLGGPLFQAGVQFLF